MTSEFKAAFYDFFAGGGMVQAGLGPSWKCLFANDIDLKKAASYVRNWGDGVFKVGDIADVTVGDLPECGDLAWASFPCQDLSLAGAGAGLDGARSSTFWPFWKLMKALRDEDRAVPIIMLENVCGALTSHSGKDFAAIGDAIVGIGYRFGAVVIDAVDFVPQSRPRLFIIAVRRTSPIPTEVTQPNPHWKWHPPSLIGAYKRLSSEAQAQWVWWRLPEPPRRSQVLEDLIEGNPKGVAWHTPEETERLLSLMNPVNLKKVEAAKQAKRRMVGTVYKRTRTNRNGGKAQRAEIRFDDIAGCLRTPVGGSSRQAIMIVEGKRVRSRLLSPREAARLMGLPDDYQLPEKYNEAYHLAGDGVVVPVVRFLAENILESTLAAIRKASKEAA